MVVIELEQDKNYISQSFKSVSAALKFINQRMKLLAPQGYFKTSEGVRVPLLELKWHVIPK
jgi:hypothetical protein